MCRYACNCRHAECAQAPDGCFIVGWPCFKHNNTADSAFSNNDIRSRDADWIETNEVVRKLAENGKPCSKALPLYIRNKLDRLANGTRFNVPKAMDKWLISQGYMLKPDKKWRDEDFEEYCADLLEYFKKTGFSPTKASSERRHGVEETNIDEDSALFHVPEMTSVAMTQILDDDQQEPTQIEERDLPCPAWKPSQSEISLLLRTPPPSPTASIRSVVDTGKPQPFQQREHHRLYALEDATATESLGYIPLQPSVMGLDKLDNDDYGLGRLHVNASLSMIASERTSTAENTQIAEEEDDYMTDLTDNSAEHTPHVVSVAQVQRRFTPFDMASQLTARPGRSSVGQRNAPKVDSDSSEDESSTVSQHFHTSVSHRVEPELTTSTRRLSAGQRGPSKEFLSFGYAAPRPSFPRKSVDQEPWHFEDEFLGPRCSSSDSSGSSDAEQEEEEYDDIFLRLAEEEMR